MYQSAVELKRGDFVLWVGKKICGEEVEIPATFLYKTAKKVAIEVNIGVGPLLRFVDRRELKCFGPKRQR